MRTRAGIFVAMVCLSLPLLAQEQQFVVTIQFSGEKAETISSFSWGVTSSAGRTAFNALSFTKPITPLSSTLFLVCASGKHYPSAVLKVAKKGKDKEQQYLEIKLVDIVVSGYQVSSAGDSTTDTTSLTYASAEYTLVAQ